MSVLIRLLVYRLEWWRSSDEDMARALEFHKRRRETLHEVLDNVSGLEVTDWRLTDDSRPHECVDIDIAVHANVPSDLPSVPSLFQIQDKFDEKRIDKTSSNAALWLLWKLTPRVARRDIEEYHIALEDRTSISCKAKPDKTEINLNFNDGTSYQVVDTRTVTPRPPPKMEFKMEYVGGWKVASPAGRQPRAKEGEAAERKACEELAMPEAERESERAELPRSEERKPSTTADRYVNLWFTRKKADEPRVDKRLTLTADEQVFLRVQIASYDERSLLVDLRRFPSQKEIEELAPETKGKPVPIDVTLFSSDFRIDARNRTRRLMLEAGEPTGTCYFGITPKKTGRAQLRVCSFYRNHLLQSLVVTCHTELKEMPAEEPQRANVEMTFSSDFSTPTLQTARGVWLGINQTTEGTHTLAVKDSGKALNWDLSDTVEAAIGKARKALLDVSFEEKGGKRVYRFDYDNRPIASNQVRRFKEDLVRLAVAGRGLYDAVLGTGYLPAAQEKDTIQPVIDDMRKVLLTEQVIQVVRLKFKDIWPWAMMYDAVIDASQVEEVCLAFRGGDGHALPYSEGVQKCVHRGNDGNNTSKAVICPYDFWGFKHVIEQPVRHGKKEAVYADLATVVTTGTEPVFLMPVEKGLISGCRTHQGEMEEMRFKTLDSHKEIMNSFARDAIEPHIVYFFCHGEYDAGSNPYLVVGRKEKLFPGDLDRADFRWTKTHALVFINGCHTVDLAPTDLATIMKPFVEAEASGVIGTEVSVHAALAVEFAQEFFKRLLKDHRSVGKIVKDLRLELLMKYNPLGLVYTPYCSADLHIAS